MTRYYGLCFGFDFRSENKKKLTKQLGSFGLFAVQCRCVCSNNLCVSELFLLGYFFFELKTVVIINYLVSFPPLFFVFIHSLSIYVFAFYVKKMPLVG